MACSCLHQIHMLHSSQGRCLARLGEVAELVMLPLSSVARQSLGAIITAIMHARDITAALHRYAGSQVGYEGTASLL